MKIEAQEIHFVDFEGVEYIRYSSYCWYCSSGDEQTAVLSYKELEKVFQETLIKE